MLRKLEKELGLNVGLSPLAMPGTLGGNCELRMLASALKLTEAAVAYAEMLGGDHKIRL